MKNFITDYINRIKEVHSLRRKVVSVFICLALVVSVGVFWNLRMTGISMTSDVVCNIEEHQHSDICNESKLICEFAEGAEEHEHTHDDTCYEVTFICDKEEHAHTVACMPNEEADVESASDWEASLPTRLLGDWSSDVLSVAKSQLGYTESSDNFVVNEDGSHSGYSRYGQWYGNLYGDWNTMFMAFCLNYANVPEAAVVRNSGCDSWVAELSDAGLYNDATNYSAEVGDIVFINNDEDEEADRVGIVSEVTEAEIIAVEGDFENTVAYVTYSFENSGIVGYLNLGDAYLRYTESNSTNEPVEISTEAPSDEPSTEENTTEEPIADESSEVNITEEPSESNTSEVAISEGPSEEETTEEPITENISTEAPIEAENNEIIENESSSVNEESLFEHWLFDYRSVNLLNSGAATLSTIVESGTTSTGVEWTLDDAGVLIFSGEGIANGSFSERDDITKVIFCEGITEVRTNFYDTHSFTEVEFPSTLTAIGNYAFEYTGVLDVVLPDSVTSIGSFAFADSRLRSINIPKGLTYISGSAFAYTNLTSIELHDGITSIGSEAFYSTNLTSIEIPESVTSIGYEAFAGTDITTIKIPLGITEIENGLFSNCQNLTTVDLHENITNIGSYAFNGCSSLTSIVIPDGITKLEDRLFYNCTSLENIVIPDSVTSIGTDVFTGTPFYNDTSNWVNGGLYFRGCLIGVDKSWEGEFEVLDGTTSISPGVFSEQKLITSVSIPDTVTAIGDRTFYNCSGLVSVSIPDSVESIGNYAFYGCTALKNIESPSTTVVGNYAFYKCTALTTVDMSSATSIGERIFDSCTSIVSVKMPNVTSVGNYAFNNCSLLESVEIPNVNTIGNYAFYGCKLLESVEIANATSIGYYAFSNCTSLTSADVANATSIGYYAFNNCAALTSIDVTNVTILGSNAFRGCTSLTSVKLPNATIVDASAFYECTALESVEAPSLTNVGAYSFYKCTSLTLVDIPKAEKIGGSAFRECSVLEKVEIPSVTTIDTYAFYNCTSLNSIDMRNVITIGNDAFNCCSSLESIDIPVATTIGARGFKSCTSLSSANMPNVTSIGTDAFTDTALLNSTSNWINGGLYISGVLVDVDTTWSGEFEVLDGTTSIAGGAFQDCTKITSVKIPDTVTQIGDSAFRNCSSLTYIDLPDNITNIGAYTFYNCKSLESIEFPNVTNIGNYAFYGCTALESIAIPNVRSIGNYAFNGCKSLETLDVPYLNKIGTYAFQNCSSLKEIDFPNVTIIGAYAFQKCSSLKSVKLPNVTYIGYYTFSNCTSLVTAEMENLTSFESNLFEGCTSLKSVNAPNVTEVGYSAFYNCKALDKLNISELDYVNSYTFYNCSSLKAIKLAKTTSVSSYAFYGCLELESIGDSEITLSSVGTYSFYRCQSLTGSVVLPEDITYMGDYAFYLCINLDIEALGSYTSVGKYAFYATDIKFIEIAKNASKIGDSAFGNVSGLKIAYNAIRSTNLGAENNVSSRITFEIGKSVDYIYGLELFDDAEEIDFLGPNIIYFANNVFASSNMLDEPLKSLSYGYYYVDEYGALYKLDKSTYEASFIYCPNGITKYTVPNYLNIELEDFSGSYNGTYHVTSVGANTLKMADDLETITFESPESITSMGTLALANCPTLTIVNGEEWLLKAVKSFSGNNYSIDILSNTNLLLGNPDYALDINNPLGTESFKDSSDGGEITVKVSAKLDTGKWVKGEKGTSYNTLTGDTLITNINVDPVGSVNDYEYRIYIEYTENDFIMPIKPGESYTFNGTTLDEEVIVTCHATDMPGVVYLVVNLQQGDTANFDINLSYPQIVSGGGGIRVWTEIVPASDAVEGEYILPDEKEKIEAWWTTIRNNFTVSKSINTYPSTPYIVGDGKGGADFNQNLVYSISIKHDNNVNQLGADYVKWIDFTDTIYLPECVKWSQTIIDDVKSGNYSAEMNSSNIEFYAGDSLVAKVVYATSISTNYVTNPEMSFDDDGNLNFSYRILNKDTSEKEYDTVNTFYYHIYKGLFDIDRELYNSSSAEERLVKNIVTADVNYSYSDSETITDDAVFTLGRVYGSVSFDKTYSNISGNHYGDSARYSFILRNSDLDDYQFDNSDDYPNVGILTDTLDKWHYIEASEIERMLNDTYGESLKINITDATLCTEAITEVTSVDGGTAYATGENSNKEYTPHNLTICWKDGNIVVIVDDQNSVIVESSLEKTLDDLGFILIEEETQYALSWDLSSTKINGGVLYGGEEINLLYFDAVVKNTFQHGTGDDRGAYDVASVAIPNKGTINLGSKILSDSVSTSFAREAYIDKTISVNGNAATALSDGDILDYSIEFGSKDDSTVYDNMPIVDNMSGPQYLLVPVEQNTQLINSELSQMTINGIDYYILSKEGIYTNVYIGTDDTGSLLVANQVSVQRYATEIKWYYSHLEGAFSKTISYKAIVDVSTTSDPSQCYIGNIVWANDRKDNRIYAEIPGIELHEMLADKEIFDIDKNKSIGDYCLITEGDTVTYRLTLRAFAMFSDYVLNGENIYDVLPNTGGTFEWNSQNVKLWYGPSSTGVTPIGIDDWYIDNSGAADGEYVIRWPNSSSITFETSASAYIFVQITFPEGEDWNKYASEIKSDWLYNTLYVNEERHEVMHELQQLSKVFLQKGVYNSFTGTGVPINLNYYSNKDSYYLSSHVDYYVTLYNDGYSRLYITTLYDILPEGFRISNTTIRTANGITSYINKDVKYMAANVKIEGSGNSAQFSISSASSTNNMESIKYDEVRKMYYLDYGEAISFQVSASVDERSKTEDIATNTVFMEYYDYMYGGIQISDCEVTHGPNNVSEGVNDGDCRLIDGNVLESKVSQIRGQVKPGIIKSFYSYTNPSGTTVYGDNNVMYDARVNWRIRLENDGTTSMDEYVVTDTMDAPYTFCIGQPIRIEIYNQSNSLIGSAQFVLSDSVHRYEVQDMMIIGNNVMFVYSSITTDPDTGEETLQLRFDGHYDDPTAVSIPANGYAYIYLSTENKTSDVYSQVFTNNATLSPVDYEFSEVSHGIPVVNDDGVYTGVTSRGLINVSYGYFTTSLKQVYEVNNPENETDSNRDINYITLGSDTSEFRYTLNVGAPQNEEMTELVLIDSLPDIGDHSPYDESVLRNSEFKVSFSDKDPDFAVVITDNTETVIDESLYTIEFSDKTVFNENDRHGVVSEEDDWSTELKPTSRSFRVIINSEQVAMPKGCKVSISFNAKADEGAMPGEIAWNNFGYYYTVDDDGTERSAEAMPLDVGVRIPYVPSIQKKLVYQEGLNTYVAEKDETFTFLIHEGEALNSYDDLKAESFGDKNVSLVTVNVNSGDSESEKILLDNLKIWSLNESGQWIMSDADFEWIKDQQYTVVEFSSEDYKLRSLGGDRNTSYSFKYSPDKNQNIICENSPKKWEIVLTKVDGSDSAKVLEGAGFAIYSKDSEEGMAVPDSLNDTLQSQIDVNGETWYLAGTEVSDAEGKINFENLKTDVYYLYEYKAPDGYYVGIEGQNIYYADTLKGSISITAENTAGKEIPNAGGDGVATLMAIGLTMMICSTAFIIMKKRKCKAR